MILDEVLMRDQNCISQIGSLMWVAYTCVATCLLITSPSPKIQLGIFIYYAR